MARKIFVNLPVQSLERSVAFFTALGFSFNAHFTDETATCMIVADDIFVMLLTHDKFKQFTPKQLCDTQVATEVLVCLSAESRGEVDALVAKASRRAAAFTRSRWISASCMATVSRIWMDISGS